MPKAQQYPVIPVVDSSALSVRPGDVRDIDALTNCKSVTWEATYAGLLPDAVIAGVAHEGARQSWEWVGECTDGVHPKGHSVLVAEFQDPVRGSRVVGYAVAGPPKSQTRLAPQYWELHAIYVLPDFWGTGAGSKLMEYTLANLPQGTEHVFLWMLEHNVRAADFYARWGFEREDLRTIGVANEPIEHRRMIKAVSQS